MRVMQMLDVSGASANSYDSGDLSTGFTTTACNTLYLINMSDLCYEVTFTGGSGRPVVGHLPNNWARPFKVTGNYDRFRIVGSNNPVGAGTAPFSHIVVESYYPDEDVSHLTDTAIPNPVTPAVNVTTAQYLINTQDPTYTQIIEVKPSGSTQDTLLFSSDGTLIVQDAANGYGQTLAIFSGQSAGNSNVWLSDPTHQTEVNGNLLVDGTSHFTGNVSFAGGFSLSGTLDLTGVVSGNSITVGSQPIASDATHNLVFNAPSGRQILHRINNVTVETINNNSIQMNQPLQVNTINQFSGTDLILNSTGVSSDILLEIAGTILFQLQNTGLGLATPLSLSGGMNLTMAAGSGLLALNQGVNSTVNGSVSGRADLYCPIWGSSLKIGWVNLTNNFQTASNVTLLFPSAFGGGWVTTGPIGPSTTLQFFNGGTQAAMRQVTGIGAANNPGTDGSISSFHQLNTGQTSACDRIIFNTTGGGNINAVMWFIGQ